MGNSLSITQKIHDLEKVLSEHIFVAQGGYMPIEVESKVAAFDLLFSLSDEEQVELIQYRTHLRKNLKKVWSKHDADQLNELARSLGHEDVYALEFWSIQQRWDTQTGIDPNKRVDTGKMVSDFIDGGQNASAGVTLKRHLDQLLNGDISKFYKTIN
jgi:hypothetical protein